MDKMNFDIFGCDHVGMVCKDIKASKKFYTEVLGMTCIYEADVPCPSGTWPEEVEQAVSLLSDGYQVIYRAEGS